MLKFKTVDELAAHLSDQLEYHDLVSVVADRQLAVHIMKELLTCENTDLTICHVDSHAYGREYLVSLYDAEDGRHLDVEQLYDDEQQKYFGTDGYVLVHENVNSKVYVDLKDGAFLKNLSCHWFLLDQDQDNCPEACPAEGLYAHREDCRDVAAEFEKSFLHCWELMDEMIEWRKLLRW